MFAIDGGGTGNSQSMALRLCSGSAGHSRHCTTEGKLPSNASKTKSGTRADFARQADKLEAAAKAMLARHRENDMQPVEPNLADKQMRRIEQLDQEAAQLRQWLSEHPHDRQGRKGTIRKSNRTDPESAKMATSKGVIQGDCGVAAVDDAHQIIVEAQAHGTGSEQELLLPIIKATEPRRTDQTLITADAGYHSETNIKSLADEDIPALIADNGMRKRGERFKDHEKYKALPDPLYDKAHAKKNARTYRPSDFTYAPDNRTCICPAGKTLYQNGSNCIHNGYLSTKFSGTLRDCVPCDRRAKCLRHPEKTQVRQVSFFRGKADSTQVSYTDLMKRAIDSPEDRALYGRRFATVEPVFGNIRHNKRLNRFTLRGQKKVDTQWKLYCLVQSACASA